MRRLFVVALLMLASLTVTAQTTMFKFNQDGEFASLSQSTDPNTSFTLNVSRNFSTGAGTTASIAYQSVAFAPDFSSVTFTQIVGNIPGGAFAGQNTQNMTLSLDVSQLDPATSINQTCTADLITFIATCGPGATRTIQLSFSQNGAQRTRVLALGQETILGPFTTRIHQRSDNSSANFSGTIFGAAVSGSNATVGINHNSSLEFIRN
jgi:hypothetical protein